MHVWMYLTNYATDIQDTGLGDQGRRIVRWCVI